MVQVPDSAVTVSGDSVTISLTNVAVVDQIQFPGGTGNNLGMAGAPATLSFSITYSKSGNPRRVRPTSSDPLSPFNWAGKMWDATNSGTFSLAYNDGTFSAQGSFSSAGNFGEMGFERNGAFVEDVSGVSGLASHVLSAAKPSATPFPPYLTQNQLNVPLMQNAQAPPQFASGPRFRGKIPIRELIH
jgi:hypothetical protein